MGKGGEGVGVRGEWRGSGGLGGGERGKVVGLGSGEGRELVRSEWEGEKLSNSTHTNTAKVYYYNAQKEQHYLCTLYVSCT